MVKNDLPFSELIFIEGLLSQSLFDIYKNTKYNHPAVHFIPKLINLEMEVGKASSFHMLLKCVIICFCSYVPLFIRMLIYVYFLYYLCQSWVSG